MVGLPRGVRSWVEGGWRRGDLSGIGRDGRAVQCTGLENRRPKGLVGSNPTPSVSVSDPREWDSDGVEPEGGAPPGANAGDDRGAAPAARRSIPLPP